VLIEESESLSEVDTEVESVEVEIESADAGDSQTIQVAVDVAGDEYSS
jgi:hypothetical protein